MKPRLRVVTADEPRWRLDIEARGYCVSYRPHEINRCPGCGRSQWWIGRILAECGFCSTAIPCDGAIL